MPSRRLIAAGLGLSAVACGCSARPPFGAEGPAAAPPSSVAKPRALRAAPVDKVAAKPVIEDAAAAEAPSPREPAADSAATNERVKALARRAEAMRHLDPAQAKRPAVAVANGPARADAPVDPPVAWLHPDRLLLPDPSRAAAAEAPPLIEPAAAVPAKAGPAVAANGPAAIDQPPVIAKPAATQVVPAAPLAGDDATRFQSQNPTPVRVDVTPPSADDAFARAVAQRVKDDPADVPAHLDYQLLRFLRDEQVPHLNAIATLPQEDRELLTALLDGLSNFRNGLQANPNMLLSKKVKPLIDLANRLRNQAELSIPTIALCSRVQAFGIYDPMSNIVLAGVEAKLILYCEVANFASRPNERGFWETKLSQEVVLYTETGNREMWRDKSDIPADLARNRRHDFYVVRRIALPATLVPGRYVLKVSVVDEQVKRVAENSVEIVVGGQPSITQLPVAPNK